MARRALRPPIHFFTQPSRELRNDSRRSWSVAGRCRKRPLGDIMKTIGSVRIIVRGGLLTAAAALAVAACHSAAATPSRGPSPGCAARASSCRTTPVTVWTVTGNGSFAFSSGIDQGGAYSVTVRSQPSNPAQTCVVHNGSGTIGTADINNVIVSCSQPGDLRTCRTRHPTRSPLFSHRRLDGRADAGRGLTLRLDRDDAGGGGGRPNGAYLYVANNGSADVSVYGIDNSTGALTATGGRSAPVTDRSP